MLIKDFQVGRLDTNCYIVTDENSLACAILDPGGDSGVILDYVEGHKLHPVCICLTHGHFDHILAVKALCEALPDIPVYIHNADLNGPDEMDASVLRSLANMRLYKEGDEIPVGALRLHVLETPGHSLGSVTLQCEKALFTGDTLFRDSCGRTDLVGGSMQSLLASLRRLAALPGDYEVYPGHADSSTLDRERRFNYYMRCAQDDR